MKQLNEVKEWIRNISPILVQKVFLFIMLALLIVFNVYYHTKIVISSDMTTMLPVAKDFINGNFILKGWVLDTNNFFFSETIFYAVGMAMGVGVRTLIHVITPSFWTFLIIFSLYAFVFKEDEFKNNISRNIIISLAFISVVGIVTMESGYTLLNANSHNNLYFFLTVCIFCLFQYTRNPQKRWIIFYLLLSAAMSFSEGVTSMVLFAPVGMLCIYYIVFKASHRRKSIIILASSILSFLLSHVVSFVIEKAGGLLTEGMPIDIAKPKEIPGRIKAFLPCIYKLFGFQNWKHNKFGFFSRVYQFFALILMISILCCIIYCCIRFVKISMTDKILLLITIINLLSCFLTGVSVIERYIVPAFVFGTLLSIKTIANFVSINFAHNGMVLKSICIFVLYITVYLGAYRIYDAYKQNIYIGPEEMLSEFIEEEELGDGYADYWIASPASYYSEFGTQMYPITTASGELRPYGALIKKDWYKEKDKHYIVTYLNGESLFIRENELEDCLGPADKIMECGQYKILYWEKDISGYMSEWRGK